MPFNVVSACGCACESVCMPVYVSIALLRLTFNDVTHLGAGRVKLEIHKKRLSDCSGAGHNPSPLAPRRH